MDNYLNFLKEPHIIDIILTISVEDNIPQKDLQKQLNISRHTIRKSLTKLRDLNLIVKNRVTLTPRGKFVATLLSNINFYLGGSKIIKEKNYDRTKEICDT